MSNVIHIIRHAEKPSDDGSTPFGVTEDGAADHHSLTTRGWRRAGCWAEYMAPSAAFPALLDEPPYVFASARATGADVADEGDGSKSRRPVQTVTSLARKLGLPAPDDRYTKGQEASVASAAAARPEATVVICWQHEAIPAIVDALIPNRIPAGWRWPDDRFNTVFIVRRTGAGEAWDLDETSPFLLSGDPTTPIFKV